MKLKAWIKNLPFFIALAGTTWLGMAQDIPQKPNIVFILADDLGYGSLNAYGAEKNLVRTPNIDRLADEGMRFTHASTPASICTPNRYGFLKGRYPWKTRLKYGVTNILSGLLPDTNRVTIADWLSKSGYHTAATGKWHLGYGDHGENPFFLYSAAVAVHHPTTPSEYMHGLSDCGPYDFIQDLDLSMGRIIGTLVYMNFMVHTIDEGGTNVPFIVSWRGMVQEGSVSGEMINLLDIFATVCEITDGKMPER